MQRCVLYRVFKVWTLKKYFSEEVIVFRNGKLPLYLSASKQAKVTNVSRFRGEEEHYRAICCLPVSHKNCELDDIHETL
jgi:hypothetical protein